jgi:hypothetical protein
MVSKHRKFCVLQAAEGRGLAVLNSKALQPSSVTSTDRGSSRRSNTTLSHDKKHIYCKARDPICKEEVHCQQDCPYIAM